MNPGAIIGGLGALAGIFGGRRKSGYERRQESLLDRQRQIADIIMRLAQGYDPEAETESSVDYARNVARKTIADAIGMLNQRYRVAGGSPGGDTNFAIDMQRTIDDPLNSLARFSAERKAGEFARRLSAYQSALSSFAAPQAGLSNLNQYDYQAGDKSPYYGLLSSSLDALFPKKKSGNALFSQDLYG